MEVSHFPHKSRNLANKMADRIANEVASCVATKRDGASLDWLKEIQQNETINIFLISWHQQGLHTLSTSPSMELFLTKIPSACMSSTSQVGGRSNCMLPQKSASKLSILTILYIIHFMGQLAGGLSLGMSGHVNATATRF